MIVSVSDILTNRIQVTTQLKTIKLEKFREAYSLISPQDVKIINNDDDDVDNNNIFRPKPN